MTDDKKAKTIDDDQLDNVAGGVKDGCLRIGNDGCFTPPVNPDDMLKDINQDKPSDENIIKIRY